MSYMYTVKLELANEKERERFDLTTITQHIHSAINQYNSLETVRHKKRLSYQVTPTVLTLDIDSPVELNVPSKAIAKFTRILLSLSEELLSIVSNGNGRVFQSIQSEIEPSNLDNISSCETLKKLVEIFSEGDIEKSNANLVMQRKIKELIFNA